MKLACKVIEDLLPLYCDGACTEETRALVETHLQECDSCRAYFAKIQEELSIPCRLIEDLLPLYHDSACSGETRMLVDMHLNSCKACRAKLEEIGGALEEPPKPDDMKPLKKLRLDWIRTRKKAILRGTIAGALCVALAVGGWWGLTRWYCIPIRSGDIHLSNVCRMSDGAIGFYMAGSLKPDRNRVCRRHGLPYAQARRAGRIYRLQRLQQQRFLFLQPGAGDSVRLPVYRYR